MQREELKDVPADDGANSTRSQPAVGRFRRSFFVDFGGRRDHAMRAILSVVVLPSALYFVWLKLR